MDFLYKIPSMRAFNSPLSCRINSECIHDRVSPQSAMFLTGSKLHGSICNNAIDTYDMALKLVLEFAICTVTKSTLPRLNFIAIMFDITCHDHVRNRTSILHTIHMDVRNQTFQLHTLANNDNNDNSWSTLTQYY